MNKTKFLLKHLLGLLPLSLLQTFCSFMGIMMLFVDAGDDPTAILFMIVLSLFCLATSLIPAKAMMFMKGKLPEDSYSDAVYFKNSERKVKVGRFTNWHEQPLWQVAIWFALGPVMFFLEIIALIAAVLSLFVEPIHADVGELDYYLLKAEKFQKVIYFLFGFVVGGVSGKDLEEYYEMMKDDVVDETVSDDVVDEVAGTEE